MYTKLDIKLGYICNNHCDFCIQWEEKRLNYPPKTLEEVYRVLRNQYIKWARVVTFTWGEPTMHKTLIPGVTYARQLGYRSINIQSNGCNFSNKTLCKKLVEAGANMFEPSIHWFLPTTHDFLVKTPWAWKKVVTGIMNLKELNQHVMINSVITQKNYKEAPHLARLLVKLWVNYFQFAFPHIGGSARKYWETVVPRKSEIMPYIHEALGIARKWWVKAHTEAIPYCFMQGYEYAITEQYLIETSVYDEAYVLDSYTNYRLKDGKAKSEKCRECAAFLKCEWPWKEYPELFGWDEFVPIRR